MQNSLEKTKIEIQQAYYGEVNRAHACITQTLSNSELTSYLIAFTDRPAALPPGVDLSTYLSGGAFHDYYILTKTFSDPFSTRSGMVFSHVLILKVSDLQYINNLEDVQSLFINKVPSNRIKLEPLVITPSQSVVPIQIKQPNYIQQTISTLLNGPYPLLFSGAIDEFKIVLQQIWNTPIKGYRNKIKFRTSFTPSDISGISDLTIVSIQTELISKWPTQNIILSEQNEQVEISKDSEKLFLGEITKNPFSSFLQDLNVIISEATVIGQAYKIYETFNIIEEITDADLLRLQIRQISKISPNSNDGVKIKESFLNQLEKLIKTDKDSNLKALRNLDLSAFNNSESKFKSIIKEFLEKILLNNKNIPFETLSETILIAFEEEPKTWWHSSFLENIKVILCSYPISKQTWELFDHSEQLLKYLLNILPTTSKIEEALRAELPTKLRNETLKIIESVSKKRKWFILHAEILLKYLEPEKAIFKQLDIEKSLNIDDSIGLEYIVDKISDQVLLDMTLLNCDSKLIKYTIQRVDKDASLLKNLDLKNPCWQTIWATTLNETRDLKNGLDGKEEKIINSIFDILIAGGQVEEIIIELVSESEFADITSYKERTNIWGKINSKYLNQFLEPTSKNILLEFLNGEISLDSIEKEVRDKIVSEDFIENFLHVYSNEIGNVTKLFESFSELTDDMLSNYIDNYVNTITDIDSKNLGVLVKNRDFTKSAKKIYEKSRIDNSFSIAYENCKSLVSHGVWDIFSQYTKLVGMESFERKKTNTYPAPMTNILILTATDKESSAVLEKSKEFFSALHDTSIQGEHAANFLGAINNFKIWHAQCEAGSGGPSGAQAVATDLINALSPKYILMPGIAFGLDQSKQKIGDILVSTHVYSYEKQRAGKTETIQRGDKVPSSPSLLSVLRAVKHIWKNADMHFGIVMSGEKLVDNAELVAQLKEMQPEAIGGEMEAAGLYAAAYRKKTDWIIFKSIVDWGMGKTSEYQESASLYASEVLFEALKIITK